ncbi:hypothetical protein C8J57DRAFT_1238572 [Mycena rebaudengoi]|nr:hypothetical protein C8J57DRAFT_1238572 [Mycena rebaudengoi]
MSHFFSPHLSPPPMEFNLRGKCMSPDCRSGCMVSIPRDLSLNPDPPQAPPAHPGLRKCAICVAACYAAQHAEMVQSKPAPAPKSVPRPQPPSATLNSMHTARGFAAPAPGPSTASPFRVHVKRRQEDIETNRKQNSTPGHPFQKETIAALFKQFLLRQELPFKQIDGSSGQFKRQFKQCLNGPKSPFTPRTVGPVRELERKNWLMTEMPEGVNNTVTALPLDFRQSQVVFQPSFSDVCWNCLNKLLWLLFQSKKFHPAERSQINGDLNPHDSRKRKAKAQSPTGKFSKPPPTKSYCVVLIENAKAVASHKYNKPTAPKLMELNRLGYVKNVQLHTDSRTLLPRLKLLFLMLPSSVSTASEPSKSMAQTLAPVRDAGPGYKNIIFIALHPLAPNLPFPSVDVTLDSPDHDLTSANESSGSDDEMADDEGGGSSTGGVKQPSGTGTPMETATNDSQSRARSPPDDADGRKSASLFDPSDPFPQAHIDILRLARNITKPDMPNEQKWISSTRQSQSKLSVDILFAKLAKHVLVPLESLNALATHIRSVGEDAKSRAELRREFDKVFGPWSCTSAGFHSALRQSLEDAFDIRTDAGNMKHAVVVGGEYGIRASMPWLLSSYWFTIEPHRLRRRLQTINDTSRALARKCANYVKSKPGPGAKPKPSPVPEDENGPRTRAQTAGASAPPRNSK